jgi:hypothetical protein
MKLPIGISDFKKLREEGYYYIDKTLFIEELLRTVGEVILIPRPRRFGKTLNLSMLQYFFEINTTSNAHLFENTAIWKQEKYRELQGTYPVIFITFKNCKASTWEKIYADMTNIITQEFRRHFEQLTPTLRQHELDDYMAIINKTASPSLYTNSLFFLSILLKRHYKKRVVILIDEYDAPIQAAYTNGYYKEMIEFMRSLLTDALKDNSYLERGVLTGILRTAKEGIFSGLNNMRVKTLLDKKFSDKFGFTTQEVDQLLSDANLTEKTSLIKAWYNGYHCATTTIYNPWSLLECIDNEGIIASYWSNTSDNELIEKLVARASSPVAAELKMLLDGIQIVKEIDYGLVFPGIEKNQKAIWSLLLFTGYLTFTNLQQPPGKTICSLTIPNEEIKLLYQKLITTIFEQTLNHTLILDLKASLLKADGELFGKVLQEFTITSMSMYDIPKNEAERSYHLFVLGLLVIMSDTFEVKSNRESGEGRYDILLIPHDKKQWGFILEFKKASFDSDEKMEATAQKALDQINDMQYAQELKDRGVTKIAAFGIACMGKKILVKSILQPADISTI